MASDLWRWADPHGQQRKVRLDELRAALAEGAIAPNTPVWRSGMTGWQSASEVPELTSASVSGSVGVVLNIPPPPLAVVAVQQQYESASMAPAPIAEEEPPPPPAYTPNLPANGPLKTQIAGSALSPSVIPPAPAVPLRTEISGSEHLAAAAIVVPPPSGGSRPPPPRLGPSMPTSVGLAPPPELFAIQKAAQSPKSVPPPVPKAASPVEELSGSALMVEESSPGTMQSPNVGRVELKSDLDPAPRASLPEGEGDPAPRLSDEIELPTRGGLGQVFDDLKAVRSGKAPKNKLMLMVCAVLGFMLLVVVVATVVSAASGGSKKTPVATKASSSATVTTAALSAPSSNRDSIPPPPPASAVASAAAATDDSKPPGPALGDCTSAGEAKSIAPKAVIVSGIEAHAFTSGIALGFAATAKDAVATMLDAKTLVPSQTVRSRPAGGDARRVTPVMQQGKLVAMADVDRKGDKMIGRRMIPTQHPIDLGYTDGAIVWAPHSRESFGKLFAIDSDIEVLRGTPLADHKGLAFAFRHGNAIQLGAAKGEPLVADGDLSRIAGPGQVGSPSIAASGDRVIVAWAERATATDDWKLRWTKVKPGGTVDEGSAFTVPEGGLGSHAMSPSVAGLGGGRFLLAWTEGPVSNHQVRAITIGADGVPSGSAIAISATGVNAGQPAAVVGADGRGLVAFLAAKGKSLEVWATPISCSK